MTPSSSPTRAPALSLAAMYWSRATHDSWRPLTLRAGSGREGTRRDGEAGGGAARMGDAGLWGEACRCDGIGEAGRVSSAESALRIDEMLLRADDSPRGDWDGSDPRVPAAAAGSCCARGVPAEELLERPASPAEGAT